jgi:hypothetical protein
LDEIEELDARIAELRESIRRSRRLILAGRAAAVAGPVMLVLLLFGALDFTPAKTIAAIVLALGGIVLTGSSRSSTDQLERALGRCEAERQAAIEGAELIQLDE